MSPTLYIIYHAHFPRITRLSHKNYVNRTKLLLSSKTISLFNIVQHTFLICFIISCPCRHICTSSAEQSIPSVPLFITLPLRSVSLNTFWFSLIILLSARYSTSRASTARAASTWRQRPNTKWHYYIKK